MNSLVRFLVVGVLCVSATAAVAQVAPTTWPTKEGTYTIDNFEFKDGERIEHLRLHYLTLGKPHRDTAGHVDNAVLLLHGTGGNAHSLLNPLFADALFSPGGVLDISKYFLILPDDIGNQRCLVEQAYGPWLKGGEWWNEPIWGQEQWNLIARAQENTLLFSCVVHDVITNQRQVVGHEWAQLFHTSVKRSGTAVEVTGDEVISLLAPYLDER